MSLLKIKEPNKKIIFYTYFLCNLTLFFVYLNRGNLGGDLSTYLIQNPEYLVISLLLVLCSFFLIIGFINFFSRIKLTYHIKNNTSNLLDYFIFFILILSLLFSILWGYGRIGADTDSLPRAVILFNKFLVPSYISAIYLFYRSNSNKKIYIYNIFLFCIYAIVQGFTGPLLLVGFLFIYKIYINGRINYKKLIAILIIAILTSPIIRIIKNIVIRATISGDYDFYSNLDVLYNINDVNSFFDLYYVYAAKVMERFESISSLYYIQDNIVRIRSLYENQQFLPFYLYHWIPQTIDKVVSSYSIYDITQDYAQRAIADLINSNYKWQIHITFWGWLFIIPYFSFLYVVYVIIVLFFACLFSKVISLTGDILNLTWYYSLLYVCHGWFNEYLLYIQGLIVFIFILIAINFISNNLRT